MSEPTWGWFGALVVINLLGLLLGTTTKVGQGGGDPRADMFRQIARRTGRIIGIGGWLPTILMLMDLLKRKN